MVPTVRESRGKIR